MMTADLRHVARRLGRMITGFDRDESGASLTEFVVGLPVFITLFVGILSIYDINKQALAARMGSQAIMWEDARDIQTGYMNMHMSPITGAVDTAMSASSFGDLADATSSVSIYADSGVKAGIAHVPMRFDPAPKLRLSGVIDDQTHAHDLLNDLPGSVDGGGSAGWVQGINQVMNASGARPAIAAGIRYGRALGEYERTVRIGPLSGSTIRSKSTVAAPTRPTTRLFAVGLSRLEMGDEDAYDNHILNFEMVPQIMQGAGCVDGPDADTGSGEQAACEADIADWNQCYNDCGLGDALCRVSCGGPPDCVEDLAGDAEQQGSDIVSCLTEVSQFSPGGLRHCIPNPCGN